MHGPREYRLICLRGALVATVQDRIAIGSAGITGRQQALVPALQQPGAIQNNHPFVAWLRRGLGHDVLHFVVRPERGIGDDWGNGLRAARDGADERDREPELHPILPPHLATAFSRGCERTTPAGTNVATQMRYSVLADASVDSEPLRRDPAPPRSYSSRGMQRFEAEVTHMEVKIDTAHQDPDAFGQGGPALETPTAVIDCMHALLVTRAAALEGCTEEAELAALADAIEAYEAVRWPLGRVPRKG